MKVWDKRFASRKASPLLEEFNASIQQDRFLYREEIEASLAWAKALCKATLLTAAELNEIESGLEKVKGRIEKGEELERFEDIHSAVELLLTEEIGETGKKLHTGRSRNEQVVTDERLFLKSRIPQIIDLLSKIQKEVIKLAEDNMGVVMPGYTHLQQAQCVLFSHYIMSLFWPMERAKTRLRDALGRMDALPLGVGALAGSSVPVDREYLRELLGFASMTDNSMDTVSDRSYILETLFALSLVLLDVSRFAEDFVVFSSQEYGFLVLDDSIATSSSLMPQKKNPDFFELIRAGAAQLFGYLTQLFITIKGLPSTYNKDLQADKIPLAKGVEETIRTLEVFQFTLTKIQPNRERMRRGLSSFLFATDVVDYLVERGVPFREAYGIVAEVVAFTEKENRALSELDLAQLQKFSSVFDADVFQIFDPLHSVNKKKTYGSTHPKQVKIQIDKARRLIERDVH